MIVIVFCLLFVFHVVTIGIVILIVFYRCVIIPSMFF